MALFLKQFFVLLMILWLLLQEKLWCKGCREDERIALLNLKAYFNYPNGNAMSYWEKNPNCCSWNYVTCDSVTRRVNYLNPQRDPRLGNWYLNTSFFLPFKELNYLDLSENNILGCIENEGFDRLSSITNLEYLDLYGNQLNNSILPSLSTLSSLNYLYLGRNKLKGRINIQELSNLTNLEFLGLQENEIEGFEYFYGTLNKSLPTPSRGFPSLQSLSLGYNSFEGTLNIKEFEAFSNLEELDLSGNRIIQLKAMEDIKYLSKLSDLTLDNVTTNGRSYSLIKSLEVFPLLKGLSLQNNDLKGVIFDQGWLSNSSLEYLNLNGSFVSEESLQNLGSLPSLNFLILSSLKNTLPIEGLPSFKKLEILDLSGTATTNIILQAIAKTPSLKTLTLSNCGLHGIIPAPSGICELKYLQELDMSSNNLNGTLPWCLANMTSIQILDLSSNNFTGKIFPLGRMTSITALRLSGNHFEIPISLSPFLNHTKLINFDGGYNEFYLESNVPNSIPKLQLQVLDLSGLGYEAFPKFLYYQYNLEQVDLSKNKIEGSFPFWLVENNTKLGQLYLSNNSLSGPFQLPNHSHMSLYTLDISNNGFSGKIPMDIGSKLPKLIAFKISRNSFSGIIPDSLSNCSGLSLLDVSDNHLSGVFPEWLGNMSALQVLDLSRNNISGNLPSNFNPLNLIHIYLSENKLQGTISNAFYYCGNLQMLDLRDNLLNGSIPKWIGNRLSLLSHLSLSHNNFEGEIPNQLCNLDRLQLIDFSHNNLSGRIPSCLKVVALNIMGAAIVTEQPTLDFTTKWETYTLEARILSMFSGIDFSANKLVGEIPPEIGNMGMIRGMNLSHNNLRGKIPSTMGNLTQIESLDLSYNNLDGEIPTQLTKLHYLSIFSVAYNNLSGKTPERVEQFATFDASSYEGNSFLCGPPLPRSCSAALPPSPEDSTDEELKEKGFIYMRDFLLSFLIGYLTVVLTMVGVLWINPRWRRAWFWYIQVFVNNCQYFLEDNVYGLFKFRLPTFLRNL